MLSVAAAPSTAADQGDRSMPKAKAFDGDKPLSSVEQVTDLCHQGKGCKFVVDGVQEYRGGVISVGNAFLNCTDHDIYVSRYVSLRPRVTDNIGGEISGRSTSTGRVQGSSQIELSGTAEGTETLTKTHEAYIPDMMKATSNITDESQTQGRLSGDISGSNTGTQSTDQTYEKSGGRDYSRTWDNSVESSTTIEATAPAGDVLTWGYVDMGHRVKGTLKAMGTSKYVKNVVLDEPSILESSSFVAQTYTAPKGACLDNRPTNQPEPDEFAAPLRGVKPEMRSDSRSKPGRPRPRPVKPTISTPTAS
ncbi:hypothetical protein [Streptomyces sp. L2]|uniref:hypothetical protein n=1 Tax=Streptomyces sp. L2 TaxID=2162665 RepID=UPI0010113E20|nr:hypothetical protein [Streptomyces sp. L2]